MAKIFIAEDDREIAELLKVVFEPAGFSTVTACEGTGLLQRIRHEQPAVVIMDVMLPGIDGYSLMMQMSQDETVRMIPVVVMTALSSARSMFDKFPQVKAFVPKPFDAADLLAQVKTLISK